MLLLLFASFFFFLLLLLLLLLFDVSGKEEEDVVVIQKPTLDWSRYRDANAVTTSLSIGGYALLRSVYPSHWLLLILF